MTVSAQAWDGRGAADREQLLELGVRMFLATVTMLFAAFTSAYLVRRAGADWRPIPLPGVLGVNTVVLAVSSAAAEMGRRAAARGRWNLARAGFVAAVALGVAFVGGQLGAWRALEGAGFVVSTLPQSAFFYMLTGVHAVHLVAGSGRARRDAAGAGAGRRRARKGSGRGHRLAGRPRAAGGDLLAFLRGALGLRVRAPGVLVGGCAAQTALSRETHRRP